MICTILLSTAGVVEGGVQVVLLVVITIIAVLSTLIITFLIGIGVGAVINVSCLYSPNTQSSAAFS